MPVVEIVRRRGGRQEITFKRAQERPRVKPAAAAPAKIPQPQFPPATETTAAAEKLFSEIFPAWAANTPLVIGASEALRKSAKAAGLPKGAANRAVAQHCKSRAYLEQLAAPGSMRHAVDGTPVEPVSEEHREHAARVLGGSL